MTKASLRFATHSAISPRPVGQLHRPDDAQAEPHEAPDSRRAAALIGLETALSPRRRACAAGRDSTAVRLEKHLAADALELPQDRRIPGQGQANLDHLAVGSGGITVIDSEAARGDVSVERVGGLFIDRPSTLKIGGCDQTRLIDAVEPN